MKIPNEVRKTVAFLAYRNQLTGDLHPVGSVFFLGVSDRPDAQYATRVFAVTAKHVIDALSRKGCAEVVFRLNTVAGAIEERAIPLTAWRSHPTDASIDAAVTEFPLPPSLDHLVIPQSLWGRHEMMVEHEVDVGDEVFISGLFQHHFGTQRNIPIVRVGNLAALDEEKIATRDFGHIDAFLIEARSIGGLSGSPVFVNLGTSRVIGGRNVISGSGNRFFLLGLVHGHYDVATADEVDSVEIDAGVSPTVVNSGIAIVVPFPKIEAVLDAVSKSWP